MQFWKIDESTKLADLGALVGSRNVDQVLQYNEIPRTPNIGQAFSNICEQAISSATQNVDKSRKRSLLGTFTTDSDVFETAALSSEADWKLISAMNTFPMHIKFPESIKVPDSTRILGNGQGVAPIILTKALEMLETTGKISPNIFSEYDSNVAGTIITTSASLANNVFECFRIPWGEIRLYSDVDEDYVDFPVYPESVSDNRKANFTEMPDLLYQYEPWYIYTSSGPRVNTYVFDFHRDMWNGNHNLGGANRLIRFCESQCYPEYNGSAVNFPTVTLYVHGQILIRGVLTDVSPDWDGPIGHDGWYLHCKLSLTINEVAQEPLNHSSIQKKGVIG